MLILKNIVKEYATGVSTIGASTINDLKGINIDFRENEFVSILGPPDSGKTTILKIICGLEKYTSGDLSINGNSTRGFSNRDWDDYRNKSVGLVLPSYNLIEHETVLANVEITMKLAGVTKLERRTRAIEVLQKVHLCDNLNKKPNQITKGEVKRTIIARALVNDPDILLVDEPIGTLDLETSLEIMKILKEISRDKLVIMVTHNMELAQKYSTRIIKLFDGKVTNDSSPYHLVVEKPVKQINGKKEKGKKTSMSLLTALSLSSNHLMTNKEKTLFISFIGSICIMVILLIMAFLSDNQDYMMKTRCKMIVFAGISLVIVIIMSSTSTYISVFARNKEVGILRSIGASKKDIFLLFNAETFIVGFASDIIGIGITLILIMPMNGSIKKIIGDSDIFKHFVGGGMVLVISSMVVSFMAGIIPSIIAAKKTSDLR